MKHIFVLILLTLASLIVWPGQTASWGEAAVSQEETTTAVRSAMDAAGIGAGILVVLNRQNSYTDILEGGHFTRGGNSGAGTGQFMGMGFEFTKGACQPLDKVGHASRYWRSQTLGCSRQLLESDWCARLVTDPYVQYTLHFITWTIGPESSDQKCQGRCQETGNKTTYIRTRVK